jgi:prepilin-type N-terminal cleavage/methylation domain-containing protein
MRRNRGFTLIEVLIVAVILAGVFTAVSILTMDSYETYGQVATQSELDSSVRSLVHTISQELRLTSAANLPNTPQTSYEFPLLTTPPTPPDDIDWTIQPYVRYTTQANADGTLDVLKRQANTQAGLDSATPATILTGATAFSLTTVGEAVRINIAVEAEDPEDPSQPLRSTAQTVVLCRNQ